MSSADSGLISVPADLDTAYAYFEGTKKSIHSELIMAIVCLVGVIVSFI